MKIGHFGFEGRKRDFQRRDVNELYKKNESYIRSKKQMITILEDLLNNEEKANVKNVSNHSEITLQENEKYTETLKDEIQSFSGDVKEQIKTLEEVRTAALSSPNPSITDLRIAIEASNQLLQMKGKAQKNEEKEQVNLALLERLKKQVYVPSAIMTMNEIKNDVTHEPYNKEVQNAIVKYKVQMKMAENNFEIEFPKYSLIA